MEFYNLNNSSDKSSWLVKYRPHKIADIIGNKQAVTSIVNWVKSYDTNKQNALKLINPSKKTFKLDIVLDEVNDQADVKMEIDKNVVNKDTTPNLIVYGDHGTGKSCSVYTILEELDYDIMLIDFSKIKTPKLILEFLDKINSEEIVDIISIMTNKKSDKKKAVVIDKLEAISSKIEKAFILALIKNNEYYWKFPIIIISDNKHNKFTSEIRKKSFEIKFWKPYISDMSILLKKIAKSENIRFAYPSIEQHLLNYCQQDIRRLLSLLQDIQITYGDKVITQSDLNSYIEMTKCKDNDFNLFSTTSLILTSYIGINNTLRLYDMDKVDLPLMIHQSYPDVVSCYSEKEDEIGIFKDIAKILSDGDNIENFIYSNQSWNIHEIHGIFTCVIPSFILENKIPTNEDLPKILPKIRYTDDPNKTSLKFINRKNIVQVNRVFPNINIFDILNIVHLLKFLLNENDIDGCSKLIKEYNLGAANIETLLKVDKIVTSKTNISSKQKNDIIKLYNEMNGIVKVKKNRKTNK